MKRKITIIGRGIDPAKNLSLAAIRALKTADRVIGIEPEKETWRALRDEFGLPEIHDVSGLYIDGHRDSDNYDRFIKYVLGLSDRYPNLVLLIAGHPRLGVTFLRKLERNVPDGLSIEVIEGISSFDVMINDLALDPLERGTAILDANRLLLFQYELEPTLAYFIYHVCSVGTSKTYYADASRDNRLELLKKYLLKAYSAEKLLYLCKASNGASDTTSLIPFSLSRLEEMSVQIDFGTTLHIPSEKPKRLDREYLKLLE